MRALALLCLTPLLAPGAIPWDIPRLSRAPQVFQAQTEEPGVRALYFESVPFKSKPTRVFAYYAAPPANGKKLPAMVLIHGGGGTAFAEWVRLWNKRGYAAIAMDTSGSVPDKADQAKLWSPPRKRHEHGGPEGWGGFERIDDPVTDQWTYHAAAAGVLAHSLIRSFPEVDANRIGLTGISWGGYLTDIVSGIDPRFRFAAPVYGCGFLGEDSAWLKNFTALGPERARKWLSLWDPSVYLPASRMPMLWVTGTNDFAYPFPSLQKSYRLPRGPRTLSIRVRMSHGHPPGATPEEIAVFAEAILKKGDPLPQILSATGNGIQYKSKRAVVKAELNYTKDLGRWQDRKWETVPAKLDIKSRKATAEIPTGATAWYINLFDDRGIAVSSEHRIIADTVPLPPQIKTMLDQRYPGWQFAPSADQIVSWFREYMAPQRPYFVTGDFNRDGTPDHAVQIIAAGKQQVVAFVAGPSGYTPYPLAEDTPDPFTFLVIYKRGDKDFDFESMKPFRYAADSLGVLYLNKTAITYTWKGETFDKRAAPGDEEVEAAQQSR